VRTTKSRELTKRFNPIYPAGHSNFRIPMEVTEHRVFIRRTEGSRLWDEDGNEYIDYMGGQGANLLGHRHPEWTKAVNEILKERSPYLSAGVLVTTDDIVVGEKLLKHIPCAEHIKFCLSGTEAVQVALRLARAYTERPLFIRFADHYHGWMDNIIGGLLNQNSQGKPFPLEDPDLPSWFNPCYTRGKGQGTVEQSLLLPWNDIECLEKTLKQYADEVAIILMEAVVTNHFCMMPRPGYLEKVRELCDKYGIVLCFDEVITGFRLGLGGAQAHVAITPDIATYGKALAGGMPFSAVMGKADIMRQLRDGEVLSPGTFNGYPLGMRAVLTTLEILERDNGAVYLKMDRVQKKLKEGLEEIGKHRGIPVLVHGVRGVFYVIFGIESGSVLHDDDDLAGMDFDMLIKFWSAMQQEGILMFTAGRWFMSTAHTDEDVDQTLEAADKCIANF